MRALETFFKDKTIHAIYSSPLLRTRQTARLINNFIRQDRVLTSSHLLETNTPFDGRPVKDLEAIEWEIYKNSPAPYEQPEDIFKRALQFIHKTRRMNPGKQIVAVTHGDVILFLALWANGYEASAENKRKVEHKEIRLVYPATASVTTLRWEDGLDLPKFEYYQG